MVKEQEEQEVLDVLPPIPTFPELEGGDGKRGEKAAWDTNGQQKGPGRIANLKDESEAGDGEKSDAVAQAARDSSETDVSSQKRENACPSQGAELAVEKMDGKSLLSEEKGRNWIRREASQRGFCING